MHSKNAPAFSTMYSRTLKQIAAAAKNVNRYHFLKHSFESGDIDDLVPVGDQVFLSGISHTYLTDPKTKRVLHVGPGSGFMLAMLEQLVDKSVTLVGMDCPEKVALANELLASKESMDPAKLDKRTFTSEVLGVDT